MAYFCHQCGKELKLQDRVGRSEMCPTCRADLHCCLNCIHYDLSAYNECHEPQADRVLEKDRSNFCDYFVFASDRKSSKPPLENAKAKLEQLFKKKK